MADNSKAVKPVETPTWQCKLDPSTALTVGQKLNLSCHGFDEVATDQRYEIVNDKNDTYSLSILEVKKDEPMSKEFVVTPYRVSEGPMVLILKNSQTDKKIFQSSLDNVQVYSVIQNKADAQMAPPAGATWILFSILEFALLLTAIVLVLGLIVYKGFKTSKRKREFKETMKLVNYEDPFLDLTVDIMSIEKNHKKILNMKPYIELALKKFFYHFFEKPVFFDTPVKLEYELKKLKILDHDLRAISVIKSDFEKIINNQEFDMDAKRDFLESAKKSIGRLKRYERTRRI